MFARRTFSWLGRTLVGVCAAGLVAGQAGTPDGSSPHSAQPTRPVAGQKSFAVDVLVDSAIRQERRLIDLMRNFKPVVETYIQEEKPDSDLGTSPKSDDYFLSRLDLTGDDPAPLAFVDQERWQERWDKKLLKRLEPFSAAGFALPLFPDRNRFDRQN